MARKRDVRIVKTKTRSIVSFCLLAACMMRHCVSDSVCVCRTRIGTRFDTLQRTKAKGNRLNPRLFQSNVTQMSKQECQLPKIIKTSEHYPRADETLT